MARNEFRRVFKHVNEAVQFAQDIVGNVLRCAGFAVKINRHFGILEPHLFDEGPHPQHSRVNLGARREFFVVDGENKSGRATLLLRKLRQIAVARNT